MRATTAAWVGAVTAPAPGENSLRYRHWVPPRAPRFARRRCALNQSSTRSVRYLPQGHLGIEGKLLAPGIFEGKPLVALLAAHDAKMSLACCDT